VTGTVLAADATGPGYLWRPPDSADLPGYRRCRWSYTTAIWCRGAGV
jgi:hypothetical protein